MHPAVFVPTYQLVFVIVGSLIISVIGSMNDVYSFELGGFAVICSQICFGTWVFRKNNTGNASVVARAFFTAEAIKLSSCFILAGVAFLLAPTKSSKFVFIGFLLTVLMSKVLIFYLGFKVLNSIENIEK